VTSNSTTTTHDLEHASCMSKNAFQEVLNYGHSCFAYIITLMLYSDVACYMNTHFLYMLNSQYIIIVLYSKFVY
jgi:hypothetical protein